MSVNAKVLMCTGMLCVAGVQVQSSPTSEPTSETTSEPATSSSSSWTDSTSSSKESTPDPLVPTAVPTAVPEAVPTAVPEAVPVNGPVTPVPAAANQIVLGMKFTVVGDFASSFHANGTPVAAVVSGLRTDITRAARNSTDAALEQYTLMDEVKNGSIAVSSRVVLAADQFTGTDEDKINAVQSLATKIENFQGAEILGEQAGLMQATGLATKASVTGLSFTREEPTASGASANGVAMMVGALFAALFAL